jgi:Zn-dependent protease
VSEQTASPARQPSSGSQLVWNLISTALLAAWIGWQMGWVWALAGVTGVFVHEFGHVLAMNALGSGPGRIMIVPFMGGAAVPRRAPLTEFRGVLISLAGPVFGLVAMAPFFLAYAWTGQRAWLGGAFFVSVINLLNLLPAPPLDGSKAIGPALAWVHPWLERGALVLVGGAAALWAFGHGQVLIALFVGLGTIGALRRGRLRASGRELNSGEWLASVGLYLGALALCLVAVALSLGSDPEQSSGLSALRRLAGH